MSELAFAPLPAVEVSRIEAELPAPNYTLRTLQEVSSAHPDWQLRLLVGSDVMRDAPRWHAFEEVTRLAPLFVLDRAGQESSHAALLPEVSSSELRGHLATPTPESEQWLHKHVPTSVLAYIRNAGLFR
jgi:nicotinate-nucleotide adenylyltransferase